MNESARTRKLCAYLEAAQFLTYPLVGGTMAPPGWPDRLIVTPSGVTHYVEAKLEGRLPNKLQHRRLTDLAFCGAHAWVLQFAKRKDLRCRFMRVERSGGLTTYEWLWEYDQVGKFLLSHSE